MTAAPLLAQMAALTDPVRCRLLVLLERHELTVSELCAILQLPQSTVSRHLKTLSDEGWVHSRRDGTSRLYALRLADLEAPVRRLWQLVRPEVLASTGSGHDERRLKSALARRGTKSREFFSTAAGQWDRLRAELFGSFFHLHALPGLLDPSWTIGDLGCGTGQVSEALAPFVRQVIAVDASTEMLQAARRRLREFTTVDVRRGDLEALPIEDEALDAATMLVLHHVPDPAEALAEARRVLRPGGRLLLVDMLPHDRDEYRRQMGHVWLGFAREQIDRLLTDSGFEGARHWPLPASVEAKGPTLFAAAARCPMNAGTREARVKRTPDAAAVAW
jgi:ArsR family transcriptional regulator